MPTPIPTINASSAAMMITGADTMTPCWTITSFA